MKRLALVTLAAFLGACAEGAPKYLLVNDDFPSAGDGGEAAAGARDGAGGTLSSGGRSANAGRDNGTGKAGASGEAGSSGGTTGAPEGMAGKGDGGDPGGESEPECEPRSVTADCAAEECSVAACTEGRCEYEPAEAGTPCGPGGALFCDGAGDCVECHEDEQCEAAGPCSIGDCNADGRCVQQVLEAGENCEDDEFCNGDETCDGRGACIPGSVRCVEPTVCNEEARQCLLCNSNNDCLDPTPICNAQKRCVCTSDAHCEVDDECRVGRCDLANGTCHIENVRAGTPVGTQKSHDCRLRQCNGSGAVVNGADNEDPPADPGGGCTRPACSAGNVVSVPRTANTPCGDGATECSLADTCNGAGTCQLNHVSNGTVVREATGGDCRRRTCDGSGNPIETLIDAACNDGNFCTGTESCGAGGVCRSSGDPCSAPRPFCVGSACHQCTADTQCSGFTSGRTGRCVGGTCRECTDQTVGADCGTHETGCEGGRCTVKCDCSQELCGRSNSELCARGR